MGEALTSYIHSEDYPSNICTKLILGREKRNCILSNIMHFIGDDDKYV